MPKKNWNVVLVVGITNEADLANWNCNGGESGDTTHPTHLNPRRCEPLDGRLGFIHNPQWSSPATPNIGAMKRVPVFRRLHSTHVELIGATSYLQRVEVAPYKAKIEFF